MYVCESPEIGDPRGFRFGNRRGFRFGDRHYFLQKIVFLVTVLPQSHFWGGGFAQISGMNVVAVARHGLIFGEDGATGSGKVSGYLRDLPDTI